ncbi:response regulator [Luteococcus sp. H138]
MKILLAEDSALLRAGLAQLLRAMGHEVIEVADGDALLRAGRTHELDLVLSDVRMPPNMADDGLAAVHQLRHERAAEGKGTLPAIVLSQYVAAAYLDRLLDHGAFGYLLKERVSDVAEFTQALTTVAAGGTIVDPEVTRALIGASSSGMTHLTDREHDVLQLMAQGLSNNEIEEALRLSRSGVSKHVANIFSKLGFDADDDNRRVRAVLTWLRHAERSHLRA